jgi:hypothetical protein
MKLDFIKTLTNIASTNIIGLTDSLKENGIVISR